MKLARVNALLASLMLMASAVMAQSCSRDNSEWSDPERWYQSLKDFDPSDTDVLYLVSTEVLSARDRNGDVCWQSCLTVDDMAAIKGEIEWVEENMFSDGFNLIAPYYHQMTFDALTGEGCVNKEEVYRNVASEVCEAFDYYMSHSNGGRPFVIAGFSQGAMLVLDLLRHMTDEQYSRMVACYMLGYRLSEADLAHPHIKAASDEGGTGVVISFNSTQTREAIWPLVSENAVTCINPLTWRTDSEPALFHYDGTANTVHVDSQTNVLLVKTDKPAYYHSFYDAAPFFLNAGVSRDNLHHWDLLFYSRQIHDNALLRARNIGR